jgi:hypothetical protein
MDPHEIAISLINNDIKNTTMIPFVYNDNILCDTQITDIFELLITIYMELISLSDANKDYNDIIIDDLINGFRECFNKLNIFLCVRTIFDADLFSLTDYGSYSNYYCKIILQNTIHGYVYFSQNSDKITPNKNYTFLLRNTTTIYKKLEDIYAVCHLPTMKICISFKYL